MTRKSASTEAKGRLLVSRRQFDEAKQAYLSERDPNGEPLYTDEDGALLEWFWGWMHSPALRGDMGRIAQRVRYDRSKIPQILRGTYGASIRTFLTVIRDLRTEVVAGSDQFISTPVTDEIRRALDTCYRRRFLAVICGQTGRSKTHTVQRWSQDNNHGQTVYVRCRSGCTRTKLIRLVAMALGRGHAKQARTLLLEEDIFAAFNQRQRRMLILDEANHMLRLGSPTAIAQAFEFVRDLYDSCNVAVALILTDYTMDAFRTGRMSGFFEQFRGRCQLYREIPERIFADEIRNVCTAYVPEPTEDLLTAAMQIASEDEGKLRTLFEYLHLATEAHRKHAIPITGKLLRQLRDRHNTGGTWPED